MPRLMTQPERIEYMLEALGMSAAKFAKDCGFTEASVSYWRTGSRVIGQTSAHRIEDRFPQFSTPWIMGETSFMNEDQKNAAKVSEAFSGSLNKTHPNIPIARQILDKCGYTMETPFDRSSTVLDASTIVQDASNAFIDLLNDDMNLTLTRREDGASFEVPLQHIDSWIAKVIGHASDSFAKMLESIEDGTMPQPKPAQWVQVDPESLKNGVQIGEKRREAAENGR